MFRGMTPGLASEYLLKVNVKGLGFTVLGFREDVKHKSPTICSLQSYQQTLANGQSLKTQSPPTKALNS